MMDCLPPNKVLFRVASISDEIIHFILFPCIEQVIITLYIYKNDQILCDSTSQNPVLAVAVFVDLL
jgi:hypothetical protein